VIRREAEGDLAEFAGALAAAGGFPGRLHGRQQKCHEQADDRDHGEQFDERHAAARPGGRGSQERRQHHAGTVYAVPLSAPVPHHR
jgi:hypothetical protein